MATNSIHESNSITSQEESYDDESERQHFRRIITAFTYYRAHSLKRLVQSERYFSELPPHHQALMKDFREHLNAVKSCIEQNARIIKMIIADADCIFENVNHRNTEVDIAQSVSEFDMDKVKSTLKQFMRDWSADGEAERQACYQPIINDLLQYFPQDNRNPADVNVLVPGAGLGRLAFEIARLGYSCQGNEFSLFMLFSSYFVLNKCKEVNAYTLYPWVHQYCNNRTNADQIQPVRFPDTNPSDMPPNCNFSMAAGDFLDIYKEPDKWDCVATVFFIDTAHNIVAYIENIWNILKPGGLWINLGPLLYHFADMPNESSIELSYDSVRRIVLQFGFELLKEQVDVPANYTQNTKSMLQYQYQCVYFVARKSSASLFTSNK